MQWNTWTTTQGRCHCGRQVVASTYKPRRQRGPNTQPLTRQFNSLVSLPSKGLKPARHDEQVLCAAHDLAPVHPASPGPDSQQLHTGTHAAGSRHQPLPHIPPRVPNAAGQEQQEDTHAANPSHLTSLLTSATHCSRLTALLTDNAHMVNPVHISAALVRGARLHGSGGQSTGGRPTNKRSRGHMKHKQPHQHHNRQQSQQQLTAIQELADLCILLLLGSPEAASSDQAAAPATPLHTSHSTARAANVHTSRHAAPLLQSCGVRELANIAWAVAKLGVDHSQIARPLLTTIIQCASHTALEPHAAQRRPRTEPAHHVAPAEPQGTASDAAVSGASRGDGWHVSGLTAGSTWVPDDNHVVRPLRRGRVPDSRLAAAQPQALVNLLWAVAQWYPDGHIPPATTSYHPPQDRQRAPSDAALGSSVLHQVIEALCSALLRNLDQASPQDVALIAWSLGTLRYQPRMCALVPTLVEALPSVLPLMTPHGVSTCIWGLSRVLSRTSQLPGHVMQAVTVTVCQLSEQLAGQPQELAMVMKGLGALGHRDPTLWRLVQAQVAASGLHRWHSGALTMLLNAYASSSRPCPDLITSIHDWAFSTPPGAAVMKLHSWTDTDLVGFVWALAALHQRTLRAGGHSPAAAAATTGAAAATATTTGNSAHDHVPVAHVEQPDEHVAAADAVQHLHVSGDTGLQSPPQQPGEHASSGGDSGARQLGASLSGEPGDVDWDEQQREVGARVKLDRVQLSEVQLLVQAVVPELAARVQQGRFSASDVSMSAWAATTCHVASTQLLCACATHATSHMREYQGRELVALLQTQAHLVAASSSAGTTADLHSALRGPAGQQQSQDTSKQCSGNSIADSQAEAVWDRLWAQLRQDLHRVLPRMNHTQLACLCTSAVRVGQADAQLLTGVLQLVLGAVAIKARSLDQQQLARAGQSLFNDVQLQPSDGGSWGQSGAASRGTARTGAGTSHGGSDAAAEDGMSVDDTDWLSVGVARQQDTQHTNDNALLGSPDVTETVTDSTAHYQQDVPLGLNNHKSAANRTVYKSKAAAASLCHAASAALHMPTPASLVTILWALSSAWFRSNRLFQLTAVICSSGGVHRLSSGQVHKLLWACVASRSYSGPLLAAVCAKLTHSASSLSPGAICDVLGLLAVARHYDVKLVAMCCMSLRPTFHLLSPQQLAVLTWAVARLNAGVMLQWRPPLHILQQRIPHMCPYSTALTLVAVATQQHVLFGTSKSAGQQPPAAEGSAEQHVGADSVENQLQQPSGLVHSTDLGGVHSAELVEVGIPDKGTTAAAAVPPVPVKFESGPAAVQPSTVSGPARVKQHTASRESLVLLHTLLAHVTHVGQSSGFQDQLRASPEVGQLLGEGLALLAVSKRLSVRAAVQECMQTLPPGVLALIQTALLTAGMSSKDRKQAVQYVGPGDAQHAVQWYAQHAVGEVASTGLAKVRKQLGSALQQLGFHVVMTDHPSPSPLHPVLPAQGTAVARATRRGAVVGVRNRVGAGLPRSGDEDLTPTDDLHDQQGYPKAYGKPAAATTSSLPLAIPGLLLLPFALPRPLAVVVAPAASFARNQPSEPLGQLFVQLTLLGDLGWQPAVLDARTWASLRGSGQVMEFVTELLGCWGVALPVGDEEGDDGDDDDEDIGYAGQSAG